MTRGGALFVVSLVVGQLCVACATAAAVARSNIETEHSSLLAKYATSEHNAVSFLQTQAQVSRAQGGCEVCVYVIENKQQHQPYLCRGLRDPAYQQSCTLVLVSLMWWLENQVYWLNYGCQRSGESNQWEWVKPCPAHAVCSWIENLYDRQPFCPPDPAYRKPSA